MREIVLLNITAREQSGIADALRAALAADTTFSAAQSATPAEHVVSVMGRQVGYPALQQVISLLSEHGLALASIERLSAAAGGNACFELGLLGTLEQPLQLRGQVLELSAALGLDIVYQPESPQRRQPRLAVFDMDSTLIEAEVIDELAKAAGIGERVAAITEQAMRGEIDFRASFKARLALLDGLDVAVLDDIGAQLRLSEGAERLFAELNRMGVKTAILSGGFTYFARQLQERLGITHVFANELQVVEGKCTGVAVEPIVDAQRKADLLQQLAREQGVELSETLAVGDGANDLAMLAIAGLGVAFRAKPLVRQSARQAISVLGLDAVLYLLGRRD
ncbi:phosphoserine phosphatase SerB [Pseudomonas sp. CFBP 13727]|uniref:phosphoserine phosphatase SerB n=1 Tax=Pseudomonas sp. CFBP 13727 TaxID=2775295 RepID=UPI0017847773|nr:phosphoserine phosphatase SerB [Pseudomonas sp. CFBP 13727]MBD8624172.1 phosphoserine phosphatase SerB [Pseudomonas sp. CFBP 13727]